ncbi:hypothetical protein BKA70DRAFT_1474827 [Coprinopsis sp. MPI-PUGE-AT-0042]|nr:hypothetical protein BKA70DRAFT_1474827 [Coprinopsis sp. MPI-PUGE-AT-0042]
MHLIWENLVKNLVLHWTGNFKDLDDGSESYSFSKSLWEAIGEATHRAGATIPSAYGPRVPDIAGERGNYVTADMWSFWTLYLAPILLRRRFSEVWYYRHFIALVRLLNVCLQFEISTEEIDELEAGFIKWVEDYERLYYQHNPARTSACPVTIHALLHIAESIRQMGPVWCYWAFPMEHYCGKLQRIIRSRRFPYPAMDRFVVEDAQLTQIGLLYNVVEELSLSPPKKPPQGFSHPDYDSCMLLPPSRSGVPSDTKVALITAALVTRSLHPEATPVPVATSSAQPKSRRKPAIATVKKYVRDATVVEWGKVKRVDSEEGDTMATSTMGRRGNDRRDNTFVRYEMYVDRHANQRRRKPEYELKTCYGQLEHIFCVTFHDTAASTTLGLKGDTVILAAIRGCVLTNKTIPGLDVHFYANLGALEVVDITTIQALVGRVPDGSHGWAIIDRSGNLARAIGAEDEDEEAGQ